MSRPVLRFLSIIWALSLITSCGYRPAAPVRERICVPFVENETPWVGLAAALTDELRKHLAVEGARIETAASSCSRSGTVLEVRIRRAVRSPARVANEAGRLVEVDGLIDLEARVTVSEPGRKGGGFDVSVSGLTPRAASAPGDLLVTSARARALAEDLAREIARRLEVW